MSPVLEFTPRPRCRGCGREHFTLCPACDLREWERADAEFAARIAALEARKAELIARRYAR